MRFEGRIRNRSGALGQFILKSYLTSKGSPELRKGLRSA